jgi:hypothetical protein
MVPFKPTCNSPTSPSDKVNNLTPAKDFEQARYILLVTREAIEGFGDKDLEAACPSVLKHLLVTGS